MLLSPCSLGVVMNLSIAFGMVGRGKSNNADLSLSLLRLGFWNCNFPTS